MLDVEATVAQARVVRVTDARSARLAVDRARSVDGAVVVEVVAGVRRRVRLVVGPGPHHEEGDQDADHDRHGHRDERLGARPPDGGGSAERRSERALSRTRSGARRSRRGLEQRPVSSSCASASRSSKPPEAKSSPMRSCPISSMTPSARHCACTSVREPSSARDSAMAATIGLDSTSPHAVRRAMKSSTVASSGWPSAVVKAPARRRLARSSWPNPSVRHSSPSGSSSSRYRPSERASRRGRRTRRPRP